MRHLFFLIGMLLTLVACVPEETLDTTGSITGRITEAGSNLPLAYSAVDISGVGQTLVTGEEGLYTFRQLPEGEYTVTASKLGYTAVKKQLVVRAGQTNTADFALAQTYADVELSTKTLDFGMELDKMTFDIVKADGSATLDWKIEQQSNTPWLSFSTTSGHLNAPRATVTVYIDRSKLTQTTLYSTDVIVRSKAGGATSLRITVMKKGAMIVAEPTSLDFSSAEVERTIVLKNSYSDDVVAYKVTSTESWCNVVNGEGTLDKNGVATVKIRVVRTNLSAATYSGALVLTSSTNNLTIPVTMQVAAKAAPEVSALQASNVRHNSIATSAYLTSVGSASVTAYGFCWSQTNTQPTTADSKNSLGGTTVSKSFHSTLTGLTPNTLYYVRAYAVNEEGVAYSSPIQVKTLTTPTRPSVKTTRQGQVQHNSAMMNGNISDLGDGFVTAYGFVFSRSNHEPTTADGVVDLGSTTAATDFEGELTGLFPETTYYVRAFAKNSIGTSYGSVVTFTTKVTPPVVMNGLLVYYNFDEENCNDALGEEDYHGIVQGKGDEMSFVKDTPSGKGFALKGSKGGKYYKILRAPEGRNSTITYSSWVKTKATSTVFYQTYGEKYIGLQNGRVLIARVDWINGNYFFDIETENILSDGKWHHLAVIQSYRGNSQLYIDGKWYATKDISWYGQNSDTFLGNFDGLLDNVRIYNRALTHKEVQEIYQAKQ